MAEGEIEKVYDVLRRRFARLLTSSSILLAAVYVLGFIYLKTYLAVFGIQIELASLSLPNLVLAHRFFVAEHFFVSAGILQSYLFSRFGWKAVKKEKFVAILILLSPLAILPIGWGLSNWSEAHIPAGFNIRAPGLWIPLLVGWIMGIVSFTVVTRSLRPLNRLRDSLWYLGAVVTLAVTVFSYRFFASVVATDRLLRDDLQLLEGVLPEPYASKSCGVVYVDSETFYLKCGDDRAVVRREAVSHYVVR